MHVGTRRLLTRLFATPPPTDLAWHEIETLLTQVGVAVTERAADRFALVKDDHVMVVHRPHPKPLAVRATVRDVAAFLKTVGITP